MKTHTIKAEVEAPNNYPFEFIQRDLVVQIFTQVEPYISFGEIPIRKGENLYTAQIKIVTNEKGDN